MNQLPSAVKYEDVTQCPICGHSYSELLYKGTIDKRREEDTDSSFYYCTSSSLATYVDIVVCRSCSLAYLHRRPSEQSLCELYQFVEDDTYLKEEAGRYKTFHQAVNDLSNLAPEKGNLFEIGSYTGIFLELARNDGWQVNGCELSDWARSIAKQRRSIDLRSETSLADIRNGSYDCVVMWDVIEHLVKPQEMLNEVYRILKPGGIFALSTIMLDSISYKLLKRYYPFLMEMHLIYFNQKTIRWLLKRHGFRILSYKRHKRYVSYAYLFKKFPILELITRIPLVQSFLEKKYFVSSVGLRDIYAVKESFTETRK